MLDLILQSSLNHLVLHYSLSAEGGSPDAEEKKLADIAKSYEEFAEDLQQKTTEVQQRTELDSERRLLEGVLAEYSQWLGNADDPSVDECVVCV